jgi:hypothetical protein
MRVRGMGFGPPGTRTRVRSRGSAALSLQATDPKVPRSPQAGACGRRGRGAGETAPHFQRSSDANALCAWIDSWFSTSIRYQVTRGSARSSTAISRSRSSTKRGLS